MQTARRTGVGATSLAIAVAAITILIVGLLMYFLAALGGPGIEAAPTATLRYPSHLKSVAQILVLRARSAEPPLRLKLESADAQELAEPAFLEDHPDEIVIAELQQFLNWRSQVDQPIAAWKPFALRTLLLVTPASGGQPLETWAELTEEGFRLGILEDTNDPQGRSARPLLERLGVWNELGEKSSTKLSSSAQELIDLVTDGSLDAALIWQQQLPRGVSDLETTQLDALEGGPTGPAEESLGLAVFEKSTASQLAPSLAELIRTDERMAEMLRERGMEILVPDE
jgi:hypothetical protein